MTPSAPVPAIKGAVLDHVGIAVPDLDAAIAIHAAFAQRPVDPPRRMPDQGIAVAFVEMGSARIELIAPIGAVSPIPHVLGRHTIQDFLLRSPTGGLHHVCYAVPDLPAALEAARGMGFEPLGNGEPIVGAAGYPIVFLDPAAAAGVLIELKGRPAS